MKNYILFVSLLKLILATAAGAVENLPRADNSPHFIEDLPILNCEYGLPNSNFQNFRDGTCVLYGNIKEKNLKLNSPAEAKGGAGIFRSYILSKNLIDGAVMEGCNPINGEKIGTCQPNALRIFPYAEAHETAVLAVKATLKIMPLVDHPLREDNILKAYQVKIIADANDANRISEAACRQIGLQSINQGAASLALSRTKLESMNGGAQLQLYPDQNFWYSQEQRSWNHGPFHLLRISLGPAGSPQVVEDKRIENPIGQGTKYFGQIIGDLPQIPLNHSVQILMPVQSVNCR